MAKNQFLSALSEKIDRIDIRSSKDLINSIINDYGVLETVFNSMLEGVVVVDKNLKVIACNKIGFKLLDINRKFQTGKLLTEIIYNKKVLDIIVNAIRNEEKLIECPVKMDRDDIEYISLNMQPLVKDGAIIGTIIIINDITNDKKNEARLRNAESLAALTTISAGIAHEIKNPLGAMSIHVQLMDQLVNGCKCKDSDELRYSLNVLQDEIERLNRIVMNFLVTVRPIKAEFMPVNVNDFFHKLIEFIKPELDNNGIEIQFKPEESFDIWMDDKYFKQAILNLIQNSIYALKSTYNPRIMIRLIQRGGYLVIEIEDNGDGISDEIVNKIFDPYFTTKDFGTGLGLTIVYKIIKEHSGEITCKSKQGRTVFSIKMPLPFLQKELLEYSG